MANLGVGGGVASYASPRGVVQADGVVQGDTATQRIMVHEGGEVNGRVKMGDPTAFSPDSADDRRGEPSPSAVGDEAQPPHGGSVFHT